MSAFDIMFIMFKKKKTDEYLGNVIIPPGLIVPPEQHEIDAALILSRHYKCSVEFLIPVNDYKRTTADVVMQGVIWEMKSPKGESKKNTIERQFKKGTKQSRNIVLDTRRTKLDDLEIEKRVLYEAKKRSSIKKVIMINKSGKIVVIQK